MVEKSTHNKEHKNHEKKKIKKSCIPVEEIAGIMGELIHSGKILGWGQSCAMTIPQCIQYALDRPAVVSCLVGAETLSELEATLNYYNSTAEERDYSFIGNLQRKDMTGVCVYCNHCLPCPAGIDIGTVNKYIDLIKTGDKIAADHYRKLSKHAGDCIGCGNCERSCPFGVNVRERIEKAKKLI